MKTIFNDTVPTYFTYLPIFRKKKHLLCIITTPVPQHFKSLLPQSIDSQPLFYFLDYHFKQKRVTRITGWKLPSVIHDGADFFFFQMQPSTENLSHFSHSIVFKPQRSQMFLVWLYCKEKSKISDTHSTYQLIQPALLSDSAHLDTRNITL